MLGAIMYKILSLDGGGTWALIQVKALLAIFGDISGHAVLSKFDMAVANSGGSIVLGGLIEDKQLSAILNDFMDEGFRQSIFQTTTNPIDRGLEFLLHFGPRFSTEKKLPALAALLPVSGGKTLPEAAADIPAANSGKPVHLLIPGFDYDRNIAAFFRSAAVGNDDWGTGQASDDITLAQAIHASSDPPVQFFDEPASWDGNSSRFWDGAIAGCNNPVLAGVAEAITIPIDPSQIRALAIGTGTIRYRGPPQDNPPPLVTARTAQDFPNDLKKLAGSITDDPPDIASFLAHVMTGGPAGLPAGAVSRVVRMNPMVSPVPDGNGGWKPPANWSVQQLNYLANLDLVALAPDDVAYIADYGDLWLSNDAPNQPIRMDADTLVSKLGPTTFQAALAAWKQITE